MPRPDSVKEWLTELRGSATPAGPTETPEPVGEGEDPTAELAEDTAPDPVDETEESVEDGTAPGESNTLPEPDTQITDSERDIMVNLAAENEALREENNDLRTRIAELGGDTTLGITEEVVEDPTPEEPEDDYDAEADVAEHEAEVARLRGDNNPKKD